MPPSFGKPAIAAAISLRSYLLVTTLSKSQRTVTLNFSDIGLKHTWDIDALPWDIFHQPSKKKFYYSLVNSVDPVLLAAITPHASRRVRIQAPPRQAAQNPHTLCHRSPLPLPLPQLSSKPRAHLHPPVHHFHRRRPRQQRQRVRLPERRSPPPDPHPRRPPPGPAPRGSRAPNRAH